jgi:succinyl-diaminopimelate desuccinylase
MTSGERAPVVDDDAVVELTRELVRARSVNDPAAGSSEAAAAAVVVRQMRAWGWSPTVVEVAPGRPNVVAVVEGGGGPGRTLMFEGHTDVVTEGDAGSWSVDPFGAELRDGRIWGRGSADMKSGVAAMLHAVRALQLTGPFPGRVVVAALVDEEGLMLGAKHFATSWRSLVGGDIDGVIVGEPEGGEVCAVAKGAVRLRLELTGAMAHGAMPQHARNPITVAAAVVGALQDLEARLQTAYSAHEHLGPAYVTPTVLLAGDTDQINVIPARAVLCVDVRTLPGMDHAGLVHDVTSAAHGVADPAGVDVVVVVVDDRPPVDTALDHPVVVALAGAHEAVTGTMPTYGGVPGATDGTILARDAGLATVVYGPGGKWIAHQADEFVEVADVLLATRVYLEAARRFVAGGER